MKKYIVVVKPSFNPNAEGAMSFKENEVLIPLTFKPLYDESNAGQNRFVENEKPRLIELKDEMSRTYTIAIDEENEKDTLQGLEKSGLIERIEEDEDNYQSFTPNDPLFASLYGLKKMQVDIVWNRGFMGTNIIVAVVDSGIDVSHPDLKNNLWDDGRGNNGFNVINDSNDLTDESHHGTHVSGTIGAIVNNNVGVAGVAPQCKIMAIKGLQGPRGSGSASNLAKGIRKAVDNNAKVINNSWGPGRSTEIRNAVEYAILNDVVVVFAAGNENREVMPQDAAGNPFVICVGATDDNDSKGSFSNFGTLVTVSAPGVNILSTIPGASYDSFNGTSMASPHVAGLAALVLSKNSKLNPGEVKKIITSNCDPINTGSNMPIGSGRVNAAKTIEAIP